MLDADVDDGADADAEAAAPPRRFPPGESAWSIVRFVEGPSLCGESDKDSAVLIRARSKTDASKTFSAQNSLS